ncbi:hypothetical protein CCACVL1_15386 [Corchorus capsularis]|uniref:Uncharacterized protein n=1 Tax=Corchorus capsularis TaxID=210143 RepID=A0A1R3I2L3_COCAP|nr:hypothetical protein CCACVL1_15386 [Corchorus capsularis]
MRGILAGVSRGTLQQTRLYFSRFQ